MSNLRRDEVVTLAATALLTGLLIFTAGREQEEDERPPGSDSDSLAAFRARGQESVLEDERNEKPGPVFVAGEGAPRALIIVPVPVGAAAHRHPASRKTSLFIHFERDGAAILTDVELGTR